MNLIRAPQAWDLTTAAHSPGSPSWTLALISTIRTSPVASRWRSPSFLTKDAADLTGHGTAVAGIIAANTNTQGITGIAPGVRLYSLKVLDDDGTTTDFILEQALNRAFALNVDVVNLSFAGFGSSDIVRRAIADLTGTGAVVVAAAGDDGTPFQHFPAAYPGVVAVGATDAAGDPAWFSDHGAWLSVVAPGVGVTSTKLASGPVGSYGTFTGSSFAAAAVSGVAALRARTVTGVDGNRKGFDLLRTAQDRGAPGYDTSFGYGIIDALAALGGGQVASPAPTPASGDPDGTIDQATLIGPHTTSTISIPTDEDWFAVDVAAPGRLEVTVTPPAVVPGRTREMDPEIEIYDPQHQRVEFRDAETTGIPEVAAANAVAGRYYVRVANFHGSASAGSYAVDVADRRPVRVGDLRAARSLRQLVLPEVARRRHGRRRHRRWASRPPGRDRRLQRRDIQDPHSHPAARRHVRRAAGSRSRGPLGGGPAGG